MRFQQLFNKIDQLIQHKESVIVAIDGKSAAGKTALGDLLKETYSCNVISMDSFFLRPSLMTPERFAEPGGNIDYERFFEEVITPLKSGKPFAYRPYDCKTAELTAPINVDPGPLSVIEGVYSMHPDFIGMYDITVFMTIDKDFQLRRLQERNPQLLKRFINSWIPMENMYFEHFRIPEKCDFIFDCEEKK